MKYISTIEERNEKSKKAKNESTISRLQRFRFGDNISPSAIHVNNLSSYSLSDQELFVLSHGMNFSLPPKSLNRLAVFAEFEVLMGQLKHHTPISIVKKQELQARLVDIAHSYCGTPINPSDRRMLRTCRDALRQLRAEESIVILKPDKGSGVVVLDKVDYIRKMTTILSDATKFRRIGPTEVHDNTSKIEDDVRKFLVELVKKKQLPKEVQEAIRPVGSQLPRLYGLPKTHKEGVPLRPILSMTNSVQHKLAKWLTRLLEPVLEFYSAHCIKDSFTFAEFMRGTVADTSSVMCSFDVSSLFTNVPLAETIRICADKLYENGANSLSLSRNNFVKLMNWAVDSVQFSFNDTIYCQIDGVAMGSPLGPTLANIFVGYQEQQLFSRIVKPSVYFRYVDDTFVILRNDEERAEFHQLLNSLHPNLRFTYEVESNNKLPFLDVTVEKCDKAYTTYVYRKPTFTGQYIRWDSFCDKRRKLNLIKCLVHRAKRICSADKLDFELEFIKATLMNNGYPEGTIQKIMKRQLDDNDLDQRAHTSTLDDTSPVYLRLPYIGPVSTVYRERIVDSITRCYKTAKPRVILTSRPILTTAVKDVLPALKRSNLVYEFTCHCDSRYVGRTTQRLLSRTKEHVPVYVRNNTHPEKNPKSAVGRHLRLSEDCRKHYSDDKFQILTFGRNEFHQSVLEALHIKEKNPNLCVQKKSVYSTLLF